MRPRRVAFPLSAVARNKNAQASPFARTGAILGAFEGNVDTVGGGIEYAAVIDKTPVILLNARHYQEYNAEHRFDGSVSILSGTIRY